MTPNVKIGLIKRTETGQTQNGYPVYAETTRRVWAEQKGPTRAEFYAAQAAGTKVTGVFTLFRGLYQGEELVELRGEHYRVVRAYPKNLTEIELTCTSEKADQEEDQDGEV